MRTLILGIAAIAFAIPAAPALAQYGGSPDQQVDGPGPVVDQSDPAEEADDSAYFDAEDENGIEAPDVDQDMDVDADVDQDIDDDADVDEDDDADADERPY